MIGWDWFVLLLAGSEMRPPLLCTVWTSLLDGLHGRVWDGKKALLLSLRTLCQSYPNLIIVPQEPGQPAVCKVVGNFGSFVQLHALFDLVYFIVC